MKRSRSYEAKVALLEREKAYPVREAIELLKKTSTAKFPETAEAAIVLGINPSQHQVRGTCALPHGTGKAVRVLVFARGEKVREAEAAGADYAGGEELAEKIQKEGWLEFERVVATPDMMSVVGKLGKILGPRGLMPSPKTNTVTMDVAAAVRELKAGMIEFRADRAGIVHSIFGKTDFTAEALQENLVALIRAVLERKPEGVRGRYIQRVFISATMGPGIRVDETDLLAAAQRKG
ncbi:MAG: 50S ribosomal protein L1 [Candidatus Bipolaricaulis sp.]|jgi:large subunit ribosomal protein L1|uniref:Large ribosomal subunit protein uL1 n=1 Tax=Candidatus Bipolaricaulis anaerobius TaxID=2026885 RepID=A0A2X3L1V3_9BACT|nr:50S ribosomal protein L1 [Candidatus Bipolaricaulis anaerobius]MBP7725761.1 50S ribosomal protein L1 [Candidatus Bipolaricaulis sp.]SQD93139.1 50S ribosomal subunit protein L1 [Candidatus Bipolaricaulis anaerobius]HOD73604.1 50S ribosomal protein L1 [Candidatus Bipolaricaulis anaerobius]HQM37572.1 50S ribosomal protein L1 [Candidatus Bipolaricaulis anaerobius]